MVHDSLTICFLKNHINVLYHILFKLKLLNSMAPDFFYVGICHLTIHSVKIISDGNPLVFPLEKNRGMGLNRGIITVSPTTPFLAKLSCTTCIQLLASVEINEIFGALWPHPNHIIEVERCKPWEPNLGQYSDKTTAENLHEYLSAS